MRGRLFDLRDANGSSAVVIINAEMAKKHWPNEDAIGQRINIGRGLGPEFEDSTREIVGIVGDVREQGLDRAAPGVMYVPSSQVPDGLMRLGNSILPANWLVRDLDSVIAPQRRFKRSS